MAEVKHTPGPWVVRSDGYYPVVRKEFHAHHHMEVCGPVHGYMYSPDERAEQEANARLIAAAPDHALIAAALCAGIARWDRSEFCIGGLRHSTRLDEFGVPVMTNGMRAALAKANGEGVS